MIHFRVNVWSKSMLSVTSSKKSCMIESCLSRNLIVKIRRRVRGWSCEPNNQLNVCTTSVTEGEVGPVKLV